MVSLGPSRGQGHTAHRGFAFQQTSERDSVRGEDVDLLTESSYVSPVVNRRRFVCLFLPWIAGFEAVLMLLYEVIVFVFADVLDLTQFGGLDPPFSLLALLHVLLWLVVMTFHFLLSLQHNYLHLRGYLQFSHTTENLRLVPPLVLTFGNAILLAFFSMQDHVWAETSFHHYYFLQIVFSLEFLIMFPAIIYYIVKVLRFQRERRLPDCYMAVDNNFQMDVDGEIGYSDSNWPNGVLEKQADMILYLQRHNENLSRRLLGQTRGTC